VRENYKYKPKYYVVYNMSRSYGRRSRSLVNSCCWCSLEQIDDGIKWCKLKRTKAMLILKQQLAMFFSSPNLTALTHRGIHDPTSNGYILFFLLSSSNQINLSFYQNTLTLYPFFFNSQAQFSFTIIIQ
jgi:hypothetical protein